MNCAAQQLSARLFDAVTLRESTRGDEKEGGIKARSPYSNTGERTTTLTPVPDSKRIAFIDYLTFTFHDYKLKTLRLVEDIDEMRYYLEKYLIADLGLAIDETLRGGRNGYKNHWKLLSPSSNGQFIDAGYVAYGGNNDTVCISISGVGCNSVSSEGFLLIRDFLEDVTGKITRIDLAHDCLNGEVSLDDVAFWYDAGLFKAASRGKYPTMAMHTDCGSGKGSTIYVGSRTSGKLFRAYEKGKQLGDTTSKWVRLELELHSTKRAIPYDILEKISDYLAGAYDCMAYLSAEQSRVATIQKSEQISFDHLEQYCKQSYGRFIDVMLSVYDGCPATVIEKLRRGDALPSRLAPYSIPIQE